MCTWFLFYHIDTIAQFNFYFWLVSNILTYTLSITTGADNQHTAAGCHGL